MKRYLLFAGFDRYPEGGWGDFIDSFDSCEEAMAEGIAQDDDLGDKYRRYEWYHVIDSETGEYV